ncbi:MAG: DUF2007 domain-containing protein, partial [Mariprofundaceae bacterium]|nr:DUF2007 domain-containing protein [Mariprofundaceae bacterium]
SASAGIMAFNILFNVEEGMANVMVGNLHAWHALSSGCLPYVTTWECSHSLSAMQCLTKTADPVTLQILCDALAEKGIEYRVNDSGIRALLPLPGVTDARIMVRGADMEAAKQVQYDLDITDG